MPCEFTHYDGEKGYICNVTNKLCIFDTPSLNCSQRLAVLAMERFGLTIKEFTKNCILFVKGLNEIMKKWEVKNNRRKKLLRHRNIYKAQKLIHKEEKMLLQNCRKFGGL